jgi:hypothetical protein
MTAREGVPTPPELRNMRPRGVRPTPSESRNGGTVTDHPWQRNETPPRGRRIDFVGFDSKKYPPPLGQCRQNQKMDSKIENFVKKKICLDYGGKRICYSS